MTLLENFIGPVYRICSISVVRDGDCRPYSSDGTPPMGGKNIG